MIRHHTLWADPRLAEAYDLVADVVREHSTDSDKLPEVAAVLTKIDKADQLLACILYERRVK